MAGTGVAAAGVVAAMPSARAAAPASDSPGAEKVTGIDVDGPVVAHVRDAATGEVSILHGDREVVVHDHELVARLTRTLAAPTSTQEV